MAGDGDEHVAEEFAEASGEIEAGAEMRRGGFTAADRAENEGNSQFAHERRLAKGHEGYMMNDIERGSLMDFSDVTISADLPEQIIKVEAAGPVLPSPAPARQIVVNGLDGERLLGDARFDGGAVVLARENENVVPLFDQSQHPVPADRGLRTFMRLTCIGGQENLHWELRRDINQTSNNFTIHSDAEVMNCGQAGQ